LPGCGARAADAGLGLLPAHGFGAAASEYAALLRSHIAKENDVLLRFAESRITAGDAVELASAFERIEREKGGHELHHRFHRELKAWEQKSR
jgi:hemerythrin-like domain-containing protein